MALASTLSFFYLCQFVTQAQLVVQNDFVEYSCVMLQLLATSAATLWPQISQVFSSPFVQAVLVSGAEDGWKAERQELW